MSLDLSTPIPPGWRGPLAFSRGVDAVNTALGRSVGWLILAAILVSAINAVIRKAFDISSNAWLELQWYLFGWAFLVAASWALRQNEHIRIDIVSAALPKRVRDWIDIVGHVVMLLPFTVLMTILGWRFFFNAFRSGEVSGSAGGLILWPARLAIFVGFVLLLFQGLSELIKRIAIMRGIIPDPNAAQPSHQPVAQ